MSDLITSISIAAILLVALTIGLLAPPPIIPCTTDADCAAKNPHIENPYPFSNGTLNKPDTVRYCWAPCD